MISLQEFINNTKGKKIALQLNLAYYFKGTPQVECSGKYDGKVSVSVDKKNKQKCVLTFTQDIQGGDTGTIKLKNIG